MSRDIRFAAESSSRQVWPADMRRCRQVNVGEAERLGSVMGGGVLALLGLLRGGLTGSAMALGGGALVYRGITGHCGAYQALGVDTHQKHPTSETPMTA